MESVCIPTTPPSKPQTQPPKPTIASTTQRMMAIVMKCYKNIPVTSPFNSFAHERFGGSFTFGIILMGWCKKDVTPLLTHWNYVFLALTHQYYNHWYLEHFHLNCPLVNIDGLVQERRNSIANALELRLSCTNLSIWQWWLLPGLSLPERSRLQWVKSISNLMSVGYLLNYIITSKSSQTQVLALQQIYNCIC